MVTVTAFEQGESWDGRVGFVVCSEMNIDNVDTSFTSYKNWNYLDRRSKARRTVHLFLY
jgi:hypothetical protein